MNCNFLQTYGARRLGLWLSAGIFSLASAPLALAYKVEKVCTEVEVKTKAEQSIKKTCRLKMVKPNPDDKKVEAKDDKSLTQRMIKNQLPQQRPNLKAGLCAQTGDPAAGAVRQLPGMKLHLPGLVPAP